MRSLSVVHVLLTLLVGVATVIALVFGLPYVIGRVLPQYESWVRDHAVQIVSIFGLVVITGGLLWANRGTSTYQSGDDPLAVARIMLAFGSKGKAIKYLESVPRGHPRAAEVQMQIQKLRQDI